MSLGITSNGMAPAQITWRDVADWSVLTGNAIEPWEAKAIVTLGLIRANIISEKSAAESKAQSSASMAKGRRSKK